MKRGQHLFLLLIFLASLGHVAPVAAQGAISTIGGNGVAGFSGDNGIADTTEINGPAGIFADDSGNIFFADQYNNRVRKINATTGIITTVAGNGAQGFAGDSGLAINAELNQPFAIFVNGAGDIYISDQYNSRIRKVNALTGIINTIAGNGTAGYNGDSIPATSAELNFPAGLFVDDSSNIYVADNDNNRVRRIDAITGLISTVAGNDTADYNGDSLSAINTELNGPMGVVIDSSGNIYIADAGNYRIRKIDAVSGIVTTIAGDSTTGYSGDGGLADSASLGYPVAIALDAEGNLYIADEDNSVIREVVGATGIINTIAGNGSAGFNGDGGAPLNAQLWGPAGIALDAGGDYFISDAGNNRIREVNILASSTHDIIAEPRFTIYPNPSNGEFMLQINEPGFNGVFQIYDLMGSKVGEGKMTEDLISVNMLNALPGIYLIRLIGAAGDANAAQKIVITH